MLKEATLSVKIIMLVTGEKVIGDIESNVGFISIKNPYCLKEMVTEDGKYSMFPFPLMPSDDEILKINHENVIVRPCNPKKELFDVYKRLTSNIIIPESNIKLV